MAGLNVAEWTPDQVADWLEGLGPTVAQYADSLRARALDGPKLLMLRCDDLEYLGVRRIGHQELLLEAVEHLRNFQYELSRECIQQLALKVSVVATSLSRQLQHHTDARLETQILADVARTVHAVKPLVCWLDRWPACGMSVSGGAGAGLAERKALLLKLSLEAATCAQRDRFAEQPARAVAAAAAAIATLADYIVQEVCDPVILTPASLDGVCVRQRGRALGFEVVPSYCGHPQLADIRFGSPAHASGAVHAGDEIVQVCGQCVIGWSGAAVVSRCESCGAGELALRVRRRGAPPAPRLAPRAPHPPSRALYVPVHIARHRTRSILSAEVKEAVKESAASSSDESEPLSPPASPSHLPQDHTRIYPPKPRALVQRRYTISCGSPITKRPNHTIEQFWQQLKQHRRDVVGSAGVSPEPGDVALYARDKAVSYSTGLETARPRTCLGLAPALPVTPAPVPCSEEERLRGKLDKSHSTPAYDFASAEPALHPPIPESPPAPPDHAACHHAPVLQVHSAEKADQILQFRKCSSQIQEAMLQRRTHDDPLPASDPQLHLQGLGPRDPSSTEKVLETINIAMMQHKRRSLLPRVDATTQEEIQTPTHRYREAGGSPPAPAPAPAPAPCPLGVLRAVPPPASPPKPAHRHIHAAQISVPLRHITKHDIRMIPSPPRHMPAINKDPSSPLGSGPSTVSSTGTATGSSTVSSSGPSPGSDIVVGAHADSKGALSPTSAVRGIFPTSKSRSLKKKSSILAKRRGIPARALAARGAAGGVWQRVRARHAAAQPRWTRRHLLLAHSLLYAYRTPDCSKADCMIYLEGFTVCAAGEVKSRAHAFKVYHTGTAFYFACDTRDAMLAWIQLIHRATLLPSLLSHLDSSNHFSETDYSETESDSEHPERRSERDRDRDKDKDKDKDKSKFGSLKKLTGRMQRSESQENVGHAATSLDRKYLRFFSRNKSKDDTKSKNKQSGVPIPTEQYRSYRRVLDSSCTEVSSPVSPLELEPRETRDTRETRETRETELRASRRIPKPINYIHASNPNLLDFEKSDFVTKPALQPPKPKVTKVQENAVGLVTLEQFMLQKQAEERRQLALYSDRVLLGVQTNRRALDTIVADVIYGEVGAPQSSGKPISVKGKDGYEKIVYPEECASETSRAGCESLSPSPPQAERWRDSLRRNDKVHTRLDSSPASKSTSQISQISTTSNDNWNNNGNESASGPGVSRLRLMFGGGRTHHSQSSPVSPGGGSRVHYPHLQCPPVFHPETYSLSRPVRPRPRDT